jgi:predicted DCC family thiol-disulfide oxidoreductase YuxK
MNRTQSSCPQQPEAGGSQHAEAIVLFDGVCNLCNASVNFAIDRDPRGRIAFASLQSPAGQELLAEHHLSTSNFDTMVLITGGRAYTRSSAALRLLGKLRMPWPLLTPLLVIPPPLRNLVYSCIAHNRYRWFGRSDACRVPTPELQSRFL